MKALVLDVETSGLVESRLMPLNKQPRIIEIYAALVDLDTGKVEKEIESLFKPPVKLTDEIIMITNITNEMVEDAPSFAEKADEINALIESAEVVIAHNAGYDKEILEIEYKRLDKTLRWKRLICTVEATIHLKGFRLSLPKLHEHLFGVRFEDSHRAKHDAEALIRCCVRMREIGLL